MISEEIVCCADENQRDIMSADIISYMFPVMKLIVIKILNEFVLLKFE